MADQQRRLQQVFAERRLACVYLGCAIVSTSALLTTRAIFQHWQGLLNLCESDHITDQSNFDVATQLVKYLFNKEDKHCGCFLYAKDTDDFLFGSARVNCDFVVYSNIPGMMVGVLLGAWHAYRLFYDLPSARKQRFEPAESKNHFGQVGIVYKPRTLSMISWLGCAFVMLVLSLISITAAILMAEGTASTCNEFRQVVVETTQAEGNLAAYFEDGLSCHAILDLMDYLRVTPDSVSSGLSVYIVMLSQWCAVTGWMAATVACLYEAFRYLRCCCYRGHVICSYWVN